MEHPLQYWKSLLILFCLLGPRMAYPQQVETVDRLVAEVGDQVITLTDLRWQIALHNYPTPQTEAEMHQLDRDVLDQLINQHLIARDISKTPFVEVTEDELNKFFDNYIQRFGSREKLDERLRELDVPELEKKGLPVPDLSIVRETIRQILTVRRTTTQLEEWVQNARSRTQIRESLFPQPLDMPNLPPQFKNQIHTVEDPFSKNPSSNR
ncbi:MAG: hypothetical protein P8Y94_08125 [Acidobacteriota bacterium]